MPGTDLALRRRQPTNRLLGLPVPSITMLDRFRSHMEQSGLVPPASRVLVGYSGGADSTALLHLLRRLGIDVVAAHLHHGMRPEAESELERCRAFAEKLEVPFLAGKADVPRMAAELHIGIEEAGRQARYGFFNQAAFGTDCDLIATAHTRTDHVETILFNVTRGTGLRGLAGIPERRDNIIRPLLPFAREETQAYCRDHRLWTHDDPANTDDAFSRSRLRIKVVPELRLVNPGLDTALIRLASIADEEDRFLDGMAAAALEQADVPLNGELRFLTDDVEIRLARQRLAHLPRVLTTRAIRLACEALQGPLSYEQTHIATAGIAGSGHGSVTADGGQVAVEWAGEFVDVRRVGPTAAFRYPLTMPGETTSDDFGWQITADELPRSDAIPARASLTAMVDFALIRASLYFRSLKPGDEMQPLGFAGRRKLSDLLSEAKLTQAARERLPIVCDMIGPIWAPGVCLSERVRPNASSQKVIRLCFGTVKAQGWHNMRNVDV